MRKLFSGPPGGAGPWAEMVVSEHGSFGKCAEPAGSLSAGLFLGCSAAAFWDAADAAVHARLGGGWESAGFSPEGASARSGLLTPQCFHGTALLIDGGLGWSTAQAHGARFQSGLNMSGEIHWSWEICPALLPILPLIPQPLQDCLERLVL